MTISKLFLPITFTLVIILTIVLTILYNNSNIPSNLYYSFLFAGIITSLNFLIGLMFIKLGLKSHEKNFMRSVFGGMLVRLIFMVSAFIICLKFLEMNENNFIFFILFFYVFYLTIEIIYLNISINK